MIKLLRRKQEKSSTLLDLTTIFFLRHQRNRIRSKNEQVGLYQTKKRLHSQGHKQRAKGNTVQEEIFVSQIAARGLVSPQYKPHTNLYSTCAQRMHEKCRQKLGKERKKKYHRTHILTVHLTIGIKICVLKGELFYYVL